MGIGVNWLRVCNAQSLLVNTLSRKRKRGEERVNNKCPYCGGEALKGKVIKTVLNYTVEHWDPSLRRWASIVAYEEFDDAKAKAVYLKNNAERKHCTERHRIIKRSHTEEVVYDE